MKKRNLVVTVLGLAGAGVLTGGLLIANSAGADPLPDPGMTAPAPNLPGGSEDCDDTATPGDQFQCDVVAALGQLDAGKANEDHQVTLVDEEDFTPNADGKVRYCFNQLLPATADYPEPAVSSNPGTETCPAENLVTLPNGPVVKHIDVTAVPGPVPSPYNFQVGHLTTTGAVIKVFDINGDIITTPVRVTIEATYKYAA